MATRQTHLQTFDFCNIFIRWVFCKCWKFYFIPNSWSKAKKSDDTYRTCPHLIHFTFCWHNHRNTITKTCSHITRWNEWVLPYLNKYYSVQIKWWTILSCKSKCTFGISWDPCSDIHVNQRLGFGFFFLMGPLI